MDEDEFELICSLDAFPDADVAPLSVSEETFWVIKRQVLHRQFRSELRLHRQEKTMKKYLTRIGTDETMCEVASKTTISNFFKEAMKDESELETETLNHRGLSEEEHTILMRELRECIDVDVIGSPLADRIRHNMGVEYEYLLLETLRNRQLVFESEDMLREKGLSKTPDVRLLLPIGVKNPKSGQLHVVNWIDSKAMFGDRHTHETENASQLQGYVNRYGPGMVIYWFGHVAQLSTDSDILIADSFPQEISLPGAFDPLASVTKLREGAEVKLQPAKIQTDFDDDWIPLTMCEL